MFTVLLFLDVGLSDEDWSFIRTIDVPALPPVTSHITLADIFETHTVESIWYRSDEQRFELFLKGIYRDDIVPRFFASGDEFVKHMTESGWQIDKGAQE